MKDKEYEKIECQIPDKCLTAGVLKMILSHFTDDTVIKAWDSQNGWYNVMSVDANAKYKEVLLHPEDKIIKREK